MPIAPFPAVENESSTYKLRKKRSKMAFISIFFPAQFFLVFPRQTNRIWKL